MTSTLTGTGADATTRALLDNDARSGALAEHRYGAGRSAAMVELAEGAEGALNDQAIGSGSIFQTSRA